MKVNYIGIACLAVLLLTACDESKYELENLVPEEYHKVLYNAYQLQYFLSQV